MITSLAITLLLVAGLGVLMAIATGVAVASTVLRPLRRLRNRVRYITETDDLKPIQVEGNDELSELTTRFNEMLEALRRSRQRQTELVADAGHELKTPLTSMRTNIELLMMMHNTDSAAISEEDKQALQSDVIAQMEELSTLIGDLIDLARQETSEKTLEPIDLLDVVNSSVERVRRRRPDVRFEIQAIPWYLEGDSFALGRAILNLLDNASKWSPADGVVRFTMQVVEREDGDRVLHMDISDSGPGIPVEDREKVFDRFYRSVSARSTPGSGLGLAIVHSTIVRHGGTVTAGKSDDGGARMRVELPGSVTDEELHSSSKTRVVQPSSTAERLDLARQRREERRNGK
ncbi:sensor histidine kinase [Corynebacterium diphtheriae]|nr:sensor histidine kinase [Corynebacterium diphtheriae]